MQRFLLTWVAESWRNGNKLAVVQKTVGISVFDIDQIQTAIDKSYGEENQELRNACMHKSRNADSIAIYHQPLAAVS
ncbi:MAG: hypothetical protein WC668_02535 [Patescibacteria group bacterium]|jgi:hypothetical protein